MRNVEYMDHSLLVIDAVDDTIGRATGSVTTQQWTREPFANSVRIVGQRSGAELEDSSADSLG